MDSPIEKIRPDEPHIDQPRSQALALIGETTEVLRKEQRVLREIAHCLFNRALSSEPGPGFRGRGRKAREFNQFMAEAEKKLAGAGAELAVLEKLRGVLSPVDDT
jgi:hypothetical protein